MGSRSTFLQIGISFKKDNSDMDFGTMCIYISYLLLKQNIKTAFHPAQKIYQSPPLVDFPTDNRFWLKPTVVTAGKLGKPEQERRQTKHTLYCVSNTI